MNNGNEQKLKLYYGGRECQNLYSVEVVRDFDGKYYANVAHNGVIVPGLPEYVDYKALKESISIKAGFEMPPLKSLRFNRVGRKHYAYLKTWGDPFSLTN